jgi:hypothetical protein
MPDTTRIDTSYGPKVYEVQGGDENRLASGGLITVDPYASAITAGISSGMSPDIWNDCPRLQMLIDPSYGIFIGDDFARSNLVTAHDYILNGINGTVTRLAANPGVVRLLATGADNDASYMTTNNTVGPIKLGADKAWWFEARVYIKQITLAQGVFVGLMGDAAAIGTDFLTTDTMALKVLDDLGFQILSATDIAAVWQTVQVLAGGARAAVDAAAATASVAWVKLGMKSVPNAAGTVSTVSFYVNGSVLTATTLSSSANFPLNKYAMPILATKTGQATSNTLDVDWWYAAQLR